VTLQAHGRTCAGQGAAVPHGIAAMFFSEANAEALRYPSTMGVLPSGRSLSGPTRHSRHRLFCYLPISPCGRAFFSLSFSRLRDLPAVPDGVDRRRLLSPACRLPSSAQVGRSARDRTPWVDLQVFASPTHQLHIRRPCEVPKATIAGHVLVAHVRGRPSDRMLRFVIRLESHLFYFSKLTVEHGQATLVASSSTARCATADKAVPLADW